MLYRWNIFRFDINSGYFLSLGETVMKAVTKIWEPEESKEMRIKGCRRHFKTATSGRSRQKRDGIITAEVWLKQRSVSGKIVFFIKLFVWRVTSHGCLPLHYKPQSKLVSSLSGALKSYLRELPEPLMTFELYSDWIQASKCVSSQNKVVFKRFILFLLNESFLSCSIQDQEKRLQALMGACEKLPPANNNNFKWVIKFI